MTEAPGTTDKRLRSLAQCIEDSEVLQWTLAQWLDFCVEAGVGRDRRTAESWLRVATVKKLMQRKPGRVGPPIFQRGTHWADYADGGQV